MYRYFYALVLLLFFKHSFAEPWDTFGSHHELKGYLIVESGELSKISPPPGVNWGVDLYKINDHCLGLSTYHDSIPYGSNAALLLVKEPSTVSVAIFEDSIGSIEVKLIDVRIYECPYGSTAKESIEIMRDRAIQQQKSLEEEIKQLKSLQSSESAE